MHDNFDICGSTKNKSNIFTGRIHSITDALPLVVVKREIGSGHSCSLFSGSIAQNLLIGSNKLFRMTLESHNMVNLQTIKGIKHRIKFTLHRNTERTLPTVFFFYIVT